MKPKCKLIGIDGNAFSIIGAVSKALRRANLRDKAEEFCNKAMDSPNYDALLRLCFEYVEVE